MAYKALYNKYRPKTFEEVAGQRSIVRTLANAIKSDKIAHAYLFCGPRGTGKTSMARLFAKALNCDQGLGCQCNECQNCTSINDGTHPDVFEIDAASNNGVDQVRELIEQVKYAPFKGRYKIYIIDEVHMMSQGAFNALLKTLEEPPEYVIFILATTEPHKVLPTIISRCQRFDFEKIGPADIKEKLLWILNQEGVSHDEKSIDVITELSDGGMRDALSILEQVLAYAGTNITENDVLTLFGLTSNLKKIEFLSLLSQGEVGQALSMLEGFISSGVDIKRLSSSLLDILKDLVIFEKTHAVNLLTSISQTEAANLEQSIDFVFANQMISVLLKAQSDYKSVSNIKSLFELTILQIAALKEKTPAPKPQIIERKVEEVVRPQNEPVKQEKTANPPDFLFEDETSKPAEPAEPTINDEPVKPVEEPKQEEKFKVTNNVLVREGEAYELNQDTIIKIFVLGNKEERFKLSQMWPEFEKLKGHPTLDSLATLLSDGKPYCLTKECLLISYNFKKLKDKANIKANQKALSEMVESILGRKVFVYALDRIDVYDCTNRFTSLQQINKLPKKDEIVLDLPKED